MTGPLLSASGLPIRYLLAAFQTETPVTRLIHLVLVAAFRHTRHSVHTQGSIPENTGGWEWSHGGGSGSNGGFGGQRKGGRGEGDRSTERWGCAETWRKMLADALSGALATAKPDDLSTSLCGVSRLKHLACVSVHLPNCLSVLCRGLNPAPCAC